VKPDPGAVQSVLGTDFDRELAPSLEPRIRAAGIIVGRLVSYGADNGVTVSDDEQTELWTWLAAWAYCLTDKPFTSNSDGASQSYAGQTGMGLEANLYGQMALTLDPTGYLATLKDGGGGTLEATGEYLGRNRRTRTPFWNR
jgi:hypothetical protein